MTRCWLPGSTEYDLLCQVDEREKRELQNQQEQYQQLQRDLADAISRLASLDDIRILLASGAKANNVVTQGLRPLHYAAYTNFIPAVRVSSGVCFVVLHEESIDNRLHN